MTKHPTCRYGGDRERLIVDYLYGDIDPGARSAFETHIGGCPQCDTEMRALRGVRQALAGWAPPEPIRALDHAHAVTTMAPQLAPAGPGRLAVSVEARRRRALDALPGWAQAAAAVLCIGVGLGAANLRITYSSDGVSVRTGWREPAAVTPAAPPAAAAAAPSVATADAWRAELTALGEQLRAEMREQTVHASPVVNADAADGDAALLKQVRALIQRSEERQQQEMAVRVNTVLNDIQNQRRADLARIERTIGVVQSNTGMEVLRQQQMINSLAVRVSSQR